MHKHRIYVIIMMVVLIFFIGCFNMLGNKTTEAPDNLQNFINSQNVKEILLQTCYKTNTGFRTEDCKLIVDDIEIKNIISIINNQKFVRFDLFNAENNKSIFEYGSLKIPQKEKLNSINLKIEFDKPVFDNYYLVLSSSATSLGVEFSAKTTTRGHDTAYICSDREFIIQIFNEALN